MTGERYKRGQIVEALKEYQRLAQGCRLPTREERLGTKPAPKEEAPTAGTSRLKADIASALSRVPFDWAQITFMNLAVGNTDWNYQRRRQRKKRVVHDDAATWREWVGDWWGLTAGQVNEITAAVVEMVYRDLNRVPLKA